MEINPHLAKNKDAQVIQIGTKLGSKFNIKDATKKNTNMISFTVLNVTLETCEES